MAIAIIVAAYLLSNAWTQSHKGRSTINVTGLASKDFSSDLIVWSATFNRKASTIQEAYVVLKKDAIIIREYLISKGVKNENIVFAATDIEKEFEYISEANDRQRQVFKGYNLSQRVQIESKEVDKIESISREVTELIDRGVELYSNSPQYYYTKLSELKIKMLADATSDARLRAEKIAENAGSNVGKLKNADMGIFQITAQNSNEDYSWGGAFNTSAKQKTASITIKLEFLIN
jgi:hypothetical protein